MSFSNVNSGLFFFLSAPRAMWSVAISGYRNPKQTICTNSKAECGPADARPGWMLRTANDAEARRGEGMKQAMRQRALTFTWNLGAMAAADYVHSPQHQESAVYGREGRGLREHIANRDPSSRYPFHPLPFLSPSSSSFSCAGKVECTKICCTLFIF